MRFLSCPIVHIVWIICTSWKCGCREYAQGINFPCMFSSIWPGALEPQWIFWGKSERRSVRKYFLEAGNNREKKTLQLILITFSHNRQSTEAKNFYLQQKWQDKKNFRWNFLSKACKGTFQHNFLELEFEIVSKAFGKEPKPFISHSNALNASLNKDKKGSV